MDDFRRQLLWHGAFLFFLGLITGFVVPLFTNSRMGLSAHLQGVLNGTFLIAIGAIWSEVRLSQTRKVVAYWSVLYGAYGNWANTTLAAAFGTGALAPIAAAGRSAEPWKETLVTTIDMTVGLAIITAVVLFLFGLRRKADLAVNVVVG